MIDSIDQIKQACDDLGVLDVPNILQIWKLYS
jgi:hypothetical protein